MHGDAPRTNTDIQRMPVTSGLRASFRQFFELGPQAGQNAKTGMRRKRECAHTPKRAFFQVRFPQQTTKEVS